MNPLDPIRPDEFLLRRIPQDKVLEDGSIAPSAFAPHSTNDGAGLSVFREAYHTPEQVGRDFRRVGKNPVWVARLRASGILELGLRIDPDPLAATRDMPAQPGHALIPALNSANAKADRTHELARRLVLVIERPLVGPFSPYGPPRPPPQCGRQELNLHGLSATGT